MRESDIIKELDILKLKIMMEGVEKEETPLQKFEKWVDEVLMMNGEKCNLCGGDCWCSKIYYPQKWAEYKTIQTLVLDLVNDKFGHLYEYQDEKPMIQRLVADTIAMTMYVQNELEDKTTN